MSRIAVVATCYNRKEKTLNCLETVYRNIEQDYNNDYNIYLLDDNSTDGTLEAVTKRFPNVKVRVSQGELYWSRGMYYAMQMAYEDNNDFYYMINDDVTFFDNAFETMMRSYVAARRDCAIVGSFLSPKDQKPTYGGLSEGNELIEPSKALKPCKLANWNCFLLTKTIIDTIGLIDRKYAHAAGDFDYCMMMHKSGLEVLVADDYIGYCERNSFQGTYRDKTLPRMKRIQSFFSIKECHFPSMMHYYLKNFGFICALGFIFACCKVIAKIILKKEIEG